MEAKSRVKRKVERPYTYSGREVWNTALPLVAKRRENDHKKNNERVALFDELGLYRFDSGVAQRQEKRGGRGIRSITLVMVERLLASIGVDKYELVIKNLFQKKYMGARDVRFALKHCSATSSQQLSDNEITILIKEWAK